MTVQRPSNLRPQVSSETQRLQQASKENIVLRQTNDMLVEENQQLKDAIVTTVAIGVVSALAVGTAAWMIASPTAWGAVTSTVTGVGSWIGSFFFNPYNPINPTNGTGA